MSNLVDQVGIGVELLGGVPSQPSQRGIDVVKSLSRKQSIPVDRVWNAVKNHTQSLLAIAQQLLGSTVCRHIVPGEDEVGDGALVVRDRASRPRDQTGFPLLRQPVLFVSARKSGWIRVLKDGHNRVQVYQPDEVL